LVCGGVFSKPGHTGKALLTVGEGKARRNAHAIPLIQAVMGEVVSGIRKGLEGKLVVAAFGFLHQQDIDILAMQKIYD
jgi:hypothetical protein